MVLLVVLVGCGSPPPATAPVDTLHRAETVLASSVDEFVAKGRTAVAYRSLASNASAAIAIDPRIAPEVERRLLALALYPMQHETHDVLAIDVWPALLGESPDRGESPTLARVVPELRQNVLAARVAERGLARIRANLASCACADDDWRDVRRSWEALDRDARAALADVESLVLADAWPAAGAGATDAPVAVAIEVSGDDIAFGGYRYRDAFRVAVLRDLRAREVAFVIHPEAPTRRLTALLRDARAAGMPTITLLARDASLGRRAYTLDTTIETTHPDESVAAFVRRIDATASAIAAR